MPVPSVPEWISPAEGATVDESVNLEWSESTINGGGGGTLIHEDAFTGSAVGTNLGSHTPSGSGAGYTTLNNSGLKILDDVAGVIGNADNGSSTYVKIDTAHSVESLTLRGGVRFLNGVLAASTGIYCRGDEAFAQGDADRLNNHLRMYHALFPGQNFEGFRVDKVIAGTATELFILDIDTAGTEEYLFELTVNTAGDVSGRYSANAGADWTSVGSVTADADLATGGALASGGIGLFSFASGSASDTDGAKLDYLSVTEN